jgi:hypothetical protein
MSPFVSSHLHGHYDLIMPWTIALFALAAPDAVRGSLKAAIAAGAVLALTAYVSYYFVVYEIALALCLVAVAAWRWSFALRATDPYPRWLRAAVATLLVVDVAALLLIFVTGGLVVDIGPVRISMRDVFNPLEVFWILLALTPAPSSR